MHEFQPKKVRGAGDASPCRKKVGDTVSRRPRPTTPLSVCDLAVTGRHSDVTSASSLSAFKNRLKTYLFRRCYESVCDSELHFLFLVIISPVQNSGPCSSFCCLGHSKTSMMMMIADIPSLCAGCARIRQLTNASDTVHLTHTAS